MITNENKLSGCKPETVKVVKEVDKRFGKVTVTSGYRSPAFNATLPNASPTSGHITGDACDIAIDGNVLDLFCFIWERKDALGIKGIGIDLHKNYLHFDRKKRDIVTTWFYDAKGNVA